MLQRKPGLLKDTQEIFPFDRLKVSEIEWITKKGGLPSEKNWIALYPGKDEEKIVKIIKSSKVMF
jgi:hypothetical protein